MDGVHDLGGKAGYGVVQIGPDDTHVGFAQRWHAQVFAIVNALSRAGITHNTDQFRHAVERVGADEYFAEGYYGRWLSAAELLFTEAGQTEFDYAPEYPAIRVVHSAPQFALQQTVRTDDQPVPGHTRLPAYARGKVGIIVAQHDGWVFPDTNAHGLGEQPQAFAVHPLQTQRGPPPQYHPVTIVL